MTYCLKTDVQREEIGVTEAEKRTHRACFTGHRPEKLQQTEKAIRKILEREILKAMDSGIHVFLSGMARGVDIWAAEIVLRLRERGHDVKLICACPYAGFERGWSTDWQRRYHAVLRKADLIRFVCPEYSPACFRLRNEWMVDHAALVIAVFNGQPGGTKNTIDYAMRTGVAYRNLLSATV